MIIDNLIDHQADAAPCEDKGVTAMSFGRMAAPLGRPKSMVT